MSRSCPCRTVTKAQGKAWEGRKCRRAADLDHPPRFAGARKVASLVPLRGVERERARARASTLAREAGLHESAGALTQRELYERHTCAWAMRDSVSQQAGMSKTITRGFIRPYPGTLHVPTSFGRGSHGGHFLLPETAAPGIRQALRHRASAPDATVGEIRSTQCHLTRKYTAGVPGRPSGLRESGPLPMPRGLVSSLAGSARRRCRGLPAPATHSACGTRRPGRDAS
jgi:hypothetical protein